MSSRIAVSKRSAAILGDPSEGDPPVPIPNTEVKPLSPDGTARASVWESRKLPGYVKSPSRKAGAFVVFGRIWNHGNDKRLAWGYAGLWRRSARVFAEMTKVSQVPAKNAWPCATRSRVA